jgi:hypothetical protein
LHCTCGDGVCDIDEELEACAADCKAPVGCGGSERYLWFDPEARACDDRGGVGWQRYRIVVGP